VCGCLQTAVSVAAGQNPHYGMTTGVLSPQMADKMVELQAGVVRVDFNWAQIEGACKGCFDWRETDAIRDEARRTGRLVFATLAYAPRWANGGRGRQYAPLDYRDWYEFVHAAVSRYADDIVLWGVWNEPNLDVFLKDGDRSVYRSLVIQARAAIKAASSRALVLGPEASWHATTSGWLPAVMADIGDLFDIVTVHWYHDGPKLEAYMDDFVRPHTRGRPIWLTEIGMQPCFSFWGELGQALFYQRVLEAFQARRSWWTGLIFFDLYEPPTPAGCGAGIVRPDWSNRLAFTVLKNFIAAFP
jgi:hypothetical protein